MRQIIEYGVYPHDSTLAAFPVVRDTLREEQELQLLLCRYKLTQRESDEGALGHVGSLYDMAPKIRMSAILI